LANRRRVFLIVGFILISFMAATLVAQPARFPVGRLDVLATTSVQPTPTPTPSIPTPTPNDFGLRIDQLEKRLDDLGSVVEVQSNSFDATVSRMESNLNLLLTILAIASLLAAILGFGIVRVWVRSLVENRLKDITSQEVSRVTQEELERIRKEWEPQFAELYEEYRRSMRR
jgi:hypothetical protein